mgnify:CR=1 FL=1
MGEHDNDDKWSPFDRLEIYAIKLFAKWLSKQQLVRPEWDEIVGKIITSNPPVINCNCMMMVKDLGELRDHWQRGHFDHQIVITHVNPNCKDPTRCKPHGETGPVQYTDPPMSLHSTITEDWKTLKYYCPACKEEVPGQPRSPTLEDLYNFYENHNKTCKGNAAFQVKYGNTGRFLV